MMSESQTTKTVGEIFSRLFCVLFFLACAPTSSNPRYKERPPTGVHLPDTIDQAWCRVVHACEHVRVQQLQMTLTHLADRPGK